MAMWYCFLLAKTLFVFLIKKEYHCPKEVIKSYFLLVGENILEKQPSLMQKLFFDVHVTMKFSVLKTS